MSTEKEDTVVLNNGVEMPALGFGCAFGNWTNMDATYVGFTPEDAWPASAMAIDAGFRHFDTALVYGTQKALGTQLGLAYASGRLKRSEVFLTTKVFHPPAGIALNKIHNSLDMTNPAVDVPARILYDFERCLQELGHGYVDLLLMHWPGTGDNAVLNRALRKQCWHVFEDLYREKKVRAIGVSNFTIRHLEALIEDCQEYPPMVNQIEVSPYIANFNLVNFCQENKIQVVAWGPFGSGATGLLQDSLLISLAEKYKKNVGQIILRWLFQRGIASLPKSSNLKRCQGNLDIFSGFSIEEEDMKQISNLDKHLSSVPHGDPNSIA